MFKRLFIVLSILLVGFLGWYFNSIRPVTVHSTPEQDFEVVSGENLDQIINNLSRNKLIRSRAAFKLTVVRLGIASKIQAGFFRLSPSMDAPTIAQKLTRAYARQVRVTIPEGLRRQEIALIVQKSLKENNPESRFDTNTFLSLTATLEGKLFPDTYDFDPKADTQTVVSRLNDNYKRVISDLKIGSDKEPEILILASLLEREAANAGEMPEVAGVLNNRLKAGWPLQVDATVQYALGTARCKKIDCDWWPKNLSRADIQFKSPYNTYENPGLPPAPISNPGRDSLSAASSPLITPNWFYIHDLSGKIHFAKTVEDHNENVCVYLKKDCQ